MRNPLPELPSLDLLRSFVAVGRKMSITLAARELCLTQSAVSRQIRNLEEQLGMRLFVRGHRVVEFTDEGRKLFQHADGWMDEMSELLGQMRASTGNPTATITASIGVTALWLLPRLGRFQHQHPEVSVRIATSNKVMNLEREAIDLAIRYCESSEAPEDAVRLFGETIAPVAHPGLGLDEVPIEMAISQHALLDLDVKQRPWMQWHGWLAHAGLEHLEARNVIRFNHYDQLIQAAVAGHGLALGRFPLLGDHVEDKRLVRLSGAQLEQPDFAYWLIRSKAGSMASAAFADWILGEAKYVALS